MRLLVLLLAFTAVGATPAPDPPAPAAFVQAVEFPYYLYPANLWERELVWLKNIGVRTVEFSIPWNWHQLRPGEFDFTGLTSPRRDLAGFLKLLRRLGLRAWVRPCAPVPGWLNGAFARLRAGAPNANGSRNWDTCWTSRPCAMAAPWRTSKGAARAARFWWTHPRRRGQPWWFPPAIHRPSYAAARPSPGRAARCCGGMWKTRSIRQVGRRTPPRWCVRARWACRATNAFPSDRCDAAPRCCGAGRHRFRGCAPLRCPNQPTASCPMAFTQWNWFRRPPPPSRSPTDRKST